MPTNAEPGGHADDEMQDASVLVTVNDRGHTRLGPRRDPLTRRDLSRTDYDYGGRGARLP